MDAGNNPAWLGQPIHLDAEVESETNASHEISDLSYSSHVEHRALKKSIAQFNPFDP